MISEHRGMMRKLSEYFSEYLACAIDDFEARKHERYADCADGDQNGQEIDV
jgi:hypothetical protein